MPMRTGGADADAALHPTPQPDSHNHQHGTDASVYRDLLKIHDIEDPSAIRSLEIEQIPHESVFTWLEWSDDFGKPTEYKFEATCITPFLWLYISQRLDN